MGFLFVFFKKNHCWKKNHPPSQSSSSELLILLFNPPKHINFLGNILYLQTSTAAASEYLTNIDSLTMHLLNTLLFSIVRLLTDFQFMGHQLYPNHILYQGLYSHVAVIRLLHSLHKQYWNLIKKVIKFISQIMPDKYSDQVTIFALYCAKARMHWLWLDQWSSFLDSIGI